NTFFFISDGASEFIRIIRRQPVPLAPKELSKESNLRLPQPLSHLDFSHQVRELVLAKWAEFQIGNDAWVSDVPCWIGLDRSLHAPLIVVAAYNTDEINIDRLTKQIDFARRKGEPRVVVICQTGTALSIASATQQLSGDLQVFTFDDFVFSALPLFR